MSYNTYAEDMFTVNTKHTKQPVAAKFLRYNDGQGDYVIVEGKRLVVPLTYDPNEVRILANKLLQGNADRVTRSGGLGEMSGYHGVLPDMYNAARAGGPIDLQRNYNGNNGSGDFVEDFTPAASYNYGLFGAAMGLPATLVHMGGGIYNLQQRYSNPNVDIGWDFGNNPKNSPYIRSGFKDLFRIEHGHTDPRECFLAGTLILMADGSRKPVEAICPGDSVMAFGSATDDANHPLVPRRVRRVFQNLATQIIDLRGLHCTPGHVFLSGESNLYGIGIFKTVASLLQHDGTLIDEDGRTVRARTGALANSDTDCCVAILYHDRTADGAPGRERTAVVRAGIPVPPVVIDGRPAPKRSLADHLAAHAIAVMPDGHLRDADGAAYGACNWPEGTTPFDEHDARNWIVESDGRPYCAPWIHELTAHDERQGLRVVGA